MTNIQTKKQFEDIKQKLYSILSDNYIMECGFYVALGLPLNQTHIRNCYI